MPEIINLNRIVLGNTSGRWLGALLVFVLALLSLRLVTRLVLARVKTLAARSTNDFDDMVAALLEKTKTLFTVLVALWLASSTLDLTPGTEQVIHTVLVVGLVLQGAFWATGLVVYSIERHRRTQSEADPGGAMAFGAITFLARVVIWTIGVLLVLDNLGIDVTALIAGLGIGGVAVALALQNVLSDLFSSLSIVLDKPFVLGDFIVVDDLLGTVEHVGLKTTRLRSLSGEQLVFSNSDLLGSRIRNFKRMNERRAVFQIGVTYETPLDKIRAIPGILRQVVEAEELTRFDRAHFKSYGAFSLDFETVYSVLVADYNRYMDIQQRINFEIFRRFQEDGIDFAYPTQTILLQGSGGTGG